MRIRERMKISSRKERICGRRVLSAVSPVITVERGCVIVSCLRQEKKVAS